MSFRLKTILGVALIEGMLLAILIGSVFSQLYTFSRNQSEDYANVILANFTSMASDGVLSMDMARLQSLASTMGRNPDIVYARIVYRDGHVLAEAGQLPDPASPLKFDTDVSSVTDGVYDVNRNIIVGGQTHGRVEAGISLLRMSQTFSHVRQQSLFIAAGEMALVALFSLLLGSYLTRQLKTLRDAAKRIGEGELGYQASVQGNDELADAIRSFNAMSNRLMQDQGREIELKKQLHSQEEYARQHLETLVTERTEALLASSRELRALVDNLPVNIVRLDLEYRVVFHSPQFEINTGFAPDGLLGRKLDDLARDGNPHAARLEMLMRQCMESGAPVEADIKLDTPNGPRIHQIRIVLERDISGIPQGLLAVSMDITERRQGEAWLALMSFAMNQVLESALLIDAQANIIFANRGASDMLGYAPEQLQRMNLADLRQDFDPQQWADHWRELQQHGNLSYETVNRHRNGQERHVEVNATYFEMDGQGYDLALGRNISERKQLESARESALLEAERLARTRSEFLANMSHEIRTPLNAVLGIAQLGARSNRGRKVQAQFVSILDAGQLLLGLIDDILDFSKIDAGKLSLEQGQVVMGDLIDQAVELTAVRAYAKGLDFQVLEAPDLPVQFSGDPLRLVQVLVNLLSNAIKFTDAGGVTLKAERAGEMLVFSVSDTGIGMSEAQIDKLFMPFEQADGSTTRRFGGTGLGLAISKRLTTMMGGDLSAQGQVGHGMTFQVKLPVPGQQPATMPKDAQPVWLIGPSCALEMMQELEQWGLEVKIGTIPDALAGNSGLLLLPYATLSQRDNLSQISHALDLGRRVALILPPGGVHGIPEEFADRLDFLPWPPRSRHIQHLQNSQKPERTPADETRAKRLDGIRVLTAEDNDVNRMILDELLKLEGAQVRSVENGLLLVDQVSQNPGAFDIVLTDVQMPEMDGYEATRRIRSMAPDLPIIGLTAHVLENEQARCLTSGMSAHVGKPTQLDHLVRVILDLLAAVGKPEIPQEILPTPTLESSPALETQEAVDWLTLESNFQGMQALLQRACSMLLDQHNATPTRLRTLAAAGQTQELLLLAHNIKGMTGNIEARPASAMAARLEQALKYQATDAPEMTEGLALEMERLIIEIRERLAQPDTEGL
jgi:PAS domain S-box-containing protein